MAEARRSTNPGTVRLVLPVAGKPRPAGEVDAGQLDIPNVWRATSQFFCLLKGELHARMMCGCSEPFCDQAVDDHINATVDMFLRAYAPSRGCG